MAITGVDIHLNSNPNAQYTLDAFRRLLAHEIGHAIGAGDVDTGAGLFIDDNYSASDPVGTLMNSWADRVNPFDPVNSVGLASYTIAPQVFAVPGIDILMESNGLGVSGANPLSNLYPLSNDDYGTRQYLYPTAVPEPSTLALALVGGTGLYWRLRRRQR